LALVRALSSHLTAARSIATLRGRVRGRSLARRRRTITALAALTLGLLAAGAGGVTAERALPGHRAHAPRIHLRRPALAPAAPVRPNIVFVLTDDLDTSLVRFMPHVRQLAARGVSFSNYFVSDSLCCPSRASLFTGGLPHDTGVFTNSGPDGGWDVFHARGEEAATFATALQGTGYRTALMGKYLNQYPARPAAGPGSPPYVPPGWSEWDVAGNGYPEYDYNLARSDRVVHHGHAPRDYLTNVLARNGLRFVDDSVAAGRPFMLELATFAPHAPAVPAPQDRDRFPGLQAPHDASFDEADMSDKPAWIRDRPPLGAGGIANLDEGYRRRVRSVQAVDRMLARIEARLAQLGVAQDTYVVFSSDNGFHLGQHRLTAGKLTAYDTDIRVPLIVAGPGVAAGAQVGALAENIDLCPTFARLGGAPVPPGADGHSLVPLLAGGPTPLGWRTGVLVEHHGGAPPADDPDFAPASSGDPPTYEALRTARSLYVEYADGEREYYDLARDPLELDDLAPRLAPAHAQALHDALARLSACHGRAQCWAAGHVGVG
jgi:N-acetylglucosamine-6-sulfatase